MIYLTEKFQINYSGEPLGNCSNSKFKYPKIFGVQEYVVFKTV